MIKIFMTVFQIHPVSSNFTKLTCKRHYSDMHALQNCRITNTRTSHNSAIFMQTIGTNNPNHKNHSHPLPPRHHFEEQCVRILSRTAQFLANSPGGLHFKAGTRPWLAALSTPYPQTGRDAN
jgi:hypothetical protein